MPPSPSSFSKCGQIGRGCQGNSDDWSIRTRRGRDEGEAMVEVKGEELDLLDLLGLLELEEGGGWG